MTQYYEFNKKNIGRSKTGILIAEINEKKYNLRFGSNEDIEAFICYGDDVIIGDRYAKVCESKDEVTQLRIFDENGISYEEKKNQKCAIYRSGMFGCIIHWR